ncbi:nitrate reductase molybdenum cofactor assembly chaperone [Mycolicibacterium crocinum]|uniref:Nitrate reductase molybdenum cofactor assembly chaperone n=1 Tax=Mycolicibacterium crocinum TaxID=388459 RepID=A0ABY3TRQ9_9MYCO|nr:nitrate reductase molybdenum cofactor assembly chaperone [Mycolicibacterium crocinum]ULN44152.1 nitrate reductase molybdenum cofactor assembly chaperone [Mycolicibacterium crocinum]
MRIRRREPDHRVLYLVAARCLDYPTTEFVAMLPACVAALAEHGNSPPVVTLRELLTALSTRTLADLQNNYVETFDFSSKHALYLSYWSDGDTRRRGEVLAQFKSVYRQSGAVIDTHGELPDYLPLVLEFAARGDLEAGRALLARYRSSLDMLHKSLHSKESHYARAVAAVCDTLPAAHATEAPPPPTELVGLTGYQGRP